jgi:hypothetical protein
MRAHVNLCSQITPLLGMFLHLGLQRVWFQAGEYLFQQVCAK